MKVRATQRGYFADKLLNPGDVFEIPSKNQFSENWMEEAPKEEEPKEENEE